MLISTVRTAILVCAFGSLYGQTPSEMRLTFEVASVKLSASMRGAGGQEVSTSHKQSGGRRSGGPGTDDPGRIHYSRTGLKDLLVEAYEVANFQIRGPNWLDEERVDIDAVMPPHTTKTQFHVMLQNLIVERFKMAIHRETKEVLGYSLVVAKNGPRLKEPTGVTAPLAYGAPEQRAEKTDRYGLPVVSPNAIEGRPAITFWNGPAGLRLYCEQQTMRDLANDLLRRLGRPVTDATGLTAKYDFNLTFTLNLQEGRSAPDGLEWAPDLFVALQSQLGLKLEPKKLPTGVIVIDRMERTPTGN